MNRFATTAASGALGAVLLATTACQAGGAAEPPAGGTAPGAGADKAGIAAVTGATLRTSEGDIEVTLFPDRAPETVANFVLLAEGGRVANPVTGRDEFYDGTLFHRVIPDFMIQGGDPQGTGTGGPGYTFGDEIDPELTFDEPGMLAMANAGPDTNGSQFFITSAPTPWLDGKHTIFGEVADGAGNDVVAAISAVETDSGDRPVEDVVLESVTIHRSGD
ncbi:peptidylprolyl isomerase [Marinitenerispora sediminis]|uniref:Peptidyl-prolyl cis-trans isomerase n=1 Tax=Marinitenerispora sediminis TaxID=1931232 RepID=A0A368SYC8_9ACTN|nr:peptidylprolyl isomerase [Marinitenerispora sediminis]RCV48209.1 peptidyl-prolyl cis-trans isomerase [Marinitenerispora sediminis]RCV48816.1 peptidyl-prolyl cis-trans isomerase [Marinitenerispora sediminis]RCV49401.1 peptidyl-prolyl cis-trans isomerase [Marinitenerispora sediminis]